MHVTNYSRVAVRSIVHLNSVHIFLAPGRRRRNTKNAAKTRLINKQEKGETRGILTFPPRAPSASERTRVAVIVHDAPPPRSTPHRSTVNVQTPRPSQPAKQKTMPFGIRHTPHRSSLSLSLSPAPQPIYPLSSPFSPSHYLSPFSSSSPLNGQLSSKNPLSSAQRFRQAAAADIASSTRAHTSTSRKQWFCPCPAQRGRRRGWCRRYRC